MRDDDHILDNLYDHQDSIGKEHTDEGILTRLCSHQQAGQSEWDDTQCLHIGDKVEDPNKDPHSCG